MLLSGTACVAIAAFLFSISTLFVKLSSDDLSAFTICAVSSGGAAVLILVTAMLSGTSLAASTTRTQGLVALRACFGACTLLAYYAAVEISGIRDSTALYFTSPLFTLVFECMVHARLPCRASMTGAFATAAGALMVSERCLCSIFGPRALGGMLCLPTVAAAASTVIVQDPQPVFAAADIDALPSLHPPPASTSTPTLTPAEALSAMSDPVTMRLRKAAWDTRRQQRHRTMMESIALFVTPTTIPDDFDSERATLNVMGTSLALSAAATNAASFITVRALGKGVSMLTLTFWHQTTIACVATLSQVWISSLERHAALEADEGLSLGDGEAEDSKGALGGEAVPGAWPSALVAGAPLIPSTHDLLLLLGIFIALLGAQVLQNRGLAIIAPSRGAAINVLQVVFCFAFDTLILGNKLQATSTLGGLLIVAGVLVLTSRLQATEGVPSKKDGPLKKDAPSKKDRDKTPERAVDVNIFSKMS